MRHPSGYACHGGNSSHSDSCNLTVCGDGLVEGAVARRMEGGKCLTKAIEEDWMTENPPTKYLASVSLMMMLLMMMILLMMRMMVGEKVHDDDADHDLYYQVLMGGNGKNNKDFPESALHTC